MTSLTFMVPAFAMLGGSLVTQVGILCLWYPLIRRAQVSEDAASIAVCRLAGVLYLAMLVSLALTMFEYYIVVVPVLGHATWHLYRKLIQPR